MNYLLGRGSFDMLMMVSGVEPFSRMNADRSNSKNFKLLN